MQKVDDSFISSSAQEHLRHLAVEAVMDDKKHKEVAQLLGFTAQTILKTGFQHCKRAS
jgi:hypothetical protein